MPNFFTTGKLSSFLSQEIIKQKQFTESKQNKGSDSSPVSEVAEVGSYTHLPNKNKAELYSEQQQHCRAPLARVSAMLHTGSSHTPPEPGWYRTFHQQIKQVSCTRARISCFPSSMADGHLKVWEITAWETTPHSPPLHGGSPVFQLCSATKMVWIKR